MWRKLQELLFCMYNQLLNTSAFFLKSSRSRVMHHKSVLHNHQTKCCQRRSSTVHFIAGISYICSIKVWTLNWVNRLSMGFSCQGVSLSIPAGSEYITRSLEFDFHALYNILKCLLSAQVLVLTGKCCPRLFLNGLIA